MYAAQVVIKETDLLPSRRFLFDADDGWLEYCAYPRVLHPEEEEWHNLPPFADLAQGNSED